MSRPIKLEHLEQAVQRIDEVKQDQITGRPGQVVGFGEDGRPKALDLPGQEIEFATAEEVEEMLNAVFGQSVLPPSGDGGTTKIASDEEVDAMLNGVFGHEPDAK
jgi:hypothetical protein